MLTRVLLALAALLLTAAEPAWAKGDLARRAERLESLVLDAAKGFSVKEYRISTGVYYRWRIESDGKEEYKLLAPDLFANSWIHQVVIEDKEVKPYGLHAVEFDDEGELEIWFITLRPGTYKFWVDRLESEGFSGAFIVE